MLSISNLFVFSLLGINAVYSYIVGPSKLQYSPAQAYCESIGSNLASINSAAEQTRAQQKCFEKAKVSGEGCWFGLNDRLGEGQFRYVDGTPVTYTNWQPGEPNNVGNEDCVEVSVGFTGKWNDFQCGIALYPLCYDIFTVGPQKLQFDAAQQYCNSIGGNLAAILSPQDQVFAQQNCFEKARVVGEGCWFGLNDRSGEGSFNYIDGTPFGPNSYSNWQPGEPNNVGNEDCVEVSVGFNGKWNDYQCGVALYPLCYHQTTCPDGVKVRSGSQCPDGYVYLGDSITAGQRIETGQGLVSANGKYTAVMQGDGNFVKYQWQNHVLYRANWATSWKGVGMSIEGRFMVYQGDDNFCMYSNYNEYRWCTMAGLNQAPGKVVMQNDGNLCIYNSHNGAVWCSWQSGGGIYGGYTIPFTSIEISGAAILTILLVINIICFVYYYCYSKKRKIHSYGKVVSMESDTEC